MGDSPRFERLLTPAEAQALTGKPASAPRRLAGLGLLPAVRTRSDVTGHRRYLGAPVLRMAWRAGRRP